jgi:hypothetical protein
MLRTLTTLSERTATKIGESRRGFLLRVGLGVAAAATAVTSKLFASAAPDRGALAADATGACYYVSGGTNMCRQLSKDQCATIYGSEWVGGEPCGVLAPPPE